MNPEFCRLYPERCVYNGKLNLLKKELGISVETQTGGTTSEIATGDNRKLRKLGKEMEKSIKMGKSIKMELDPFYGLSKESSGSDNRLGIKFVPYSQFLDVDSDDEMNTSTRQELERMNKYQGESSSSSSRPVSNVLNNIYDPFVRFPNDINSYLSSVGDEFFNEPEPEQPKKPENVNSLNTLREDTYASLDFANQP